jgi:hypothetical protein
MRTLSKWIAASSEDCRTALEELGAAAIGGFKKVCPPGKAQFL